jgi:molecular chaperone GrpE
MTEAEQIETLTTERDDLLGRLQRVSADYLNYQKRVGREKAEARDFIVADVLAAMFDVMDDLELAVNHARQNHPADDPLLIGTDLVHQKAQGVFKRFGVERIVAEGTFDPALHEAIVSQPTDEVEPMTILSEVRTGYRMGERVVRPARVIVAAAATNDDNAASDCETADRPEGANDADV